MDSGKARDSRHGAITALARGLLALRWVRFGIVGGTAAVTYALLGLFFVNICALPALAGNALAYVLSFVVSYLGQSLWTFRAAGAATAAACHRAMLPRFAATQAVGLALNSAIVWALMSLGLRYEFAMPTAVLLVPIMVYALCKYWVFKPGAKPGAASDSSTPGQCPGEPDLPGISSPDSSNKEQS